ncbi:hypothetical protein TrRE_jg195 [Triparma retinervis]|uniref:Protein kinase domain-containing protein n=1 Tax=Triparma retinervis TaxID=2557542 RepID=A0A9W7FWP2_9STRA|nr:hypothetical protein TrRE_jg195 [Triparma retinervis]
MKSDPELWDKIQPKVFKKGRKKEKYVVKTFLTTSFADSEGDPIEQPRTHSPLPYQLVRSSPSLDIWSFGTILYALCTGSPLFNVNRDDDLKEGVDMHEVATWDDAKKIKSLAEINDPMAKDLLSKLLSRDPDDRPGTFQDVLNHSFFTMEGVGGDTKLLQEMREEMTSNFKKQEEYHAKSEKLMQNIMDNTIELKSMGKETMDKIDASTGVLCKAIFDATEVSTPTCFIILPYMLPLPPKEGEDDDSLVARAKEILDKAEDFMDNVTNLTETTSSFISNPASFAMNFGSSMFKGKVAEMKSKLVDKEMYMYLVDEFTNEPVYDHSRLYPKVIETKSDLVDQHMPMMRVGLQAMAVMNGATGLASCFCPGVPSRLVPKGLMEKATKFVNGLDKESNVADYDVVQGEVERQGEGSSGAKRGGELREYEKFLMEHDPEGAFANLVRVCDQGSGRAIWVTKESAAKIEGKAGGESGGGGEAGNGAGVYEAEIRIMQEEKKKWEEEKKKLVAEIEGKAGGEAGGGGDAGGGGEAYEAEIRRMQEEKKKWEEEKKKLAEEITKLRKDNGQGHNTGMIQSQSTEDIDVKRKTKGNKKTGDGQENMGSAAKLRQTVSAERDTEAWQSRDDGLIRKMEEMQRQHREEMQRQLREEMQRQLGKVDEKIGKVDDKMNEVVGAVKSAKLKKKGMFF